MDDINFKDSVRVDAGVISFSEDILIKSVSCFDGKTLVTLLICEDTLVSFSIDGTNSNIVLKTLFGALHGYSLHSCLHEMVRCLHDIYNINHIIIDFHYEKD